MSLTDWKRPLPSSSNSDTSPLKKKTKIALKRVTANSSSDDDEIEIPTTTNRTVAKSVVDNSSTASRIKIRRSSSSSSSSGESNGSDEILTTRTRKRRKKTIPNERSTILNQMKQKAQERKLSAQSTTETVQQEKPIVKKCPFQFSDEEPAKNNDDDGETTESYDANELEEKTLSVNNGTTKQETKTEQEKQDEQEQDEKSEETVSPRKRGRRRKNIRDIIEDKELDTSTQNAVQIELERRQRIAEKQREYNDILLETSKFRQNEIRRTSEKRLILELDPKTNEPLIEVSPKLVGHLKQHQSDGIRFLWNNVFESVEAIQNKDNQGSGCILAHCMGLGKTLQVVSFLHTIFNYDHLTKVKRCLVLCPINVALNWSNEFDSWLHEVDPPVDHYQLTTIKPNLRIAHLNYWYEHGGVMIMGYEMYRRLANGFGLRNKKIRNQVNEFLVDPGPDLIVADEGHILKNSQTALAKCLSKIRTKRRIVLTGTPLQNNLMEYYCMVSFIKPSLLGTQQEYVNRFVSPIENGQHLDSSEADVLLMKRRACVLHELLGGFIDRKDYSLLKDYLPPKFEYIINIRLSDLQTNLYKIYLNNQQDPNSPKRDFKSMKLFADYQYLQKVWTQPFLLYPHFVDNWRKRSNKQDKFLDDNDIEAKFTDDEEEEEEEEAEENDERKKGSKKKKNRRQSSENERNSASEDSNMVVDDDSKSTSGSVNNYLTRSQRAGQSIRRKASKKKKGNLNVDIFDTGDDQQASLDTVNEEDDEEDEEEDIEEDPWTKDMRQQFWFPFLDMLPDESEFDIDLSGKFLLFKSILDKCGEIGDKILVFSRSLYTLNYIERFLRFLHEQNDENYRKQCDARREARRSMTDDDKTPLFDYIPPPVRWRPEEDYFRMDGQTDVVLRKRFAKAFNDETNLRARLFLISTLAGGIGINLVGSNRVIIFDASWNPSHDTQAIFRSYRFGQKKPVYIYRFLAHGTMEEKIYQRQVVKQSLAQRVIDDHQLDRHFTENDIKELYKFTPESLPEDRSINKDDFPYSIPKDHLLLDLLYDHHRWIHSYHSHDSLLENRVDEGLTDEERRRALEEYEILKIAPDPRHFNYNRFQDNLGVLSPMVQLPQIQQLYAEFFRSQTEAAMSDYAKMVQRIMEFGLQQNIYESDTMNATTTPAELSRSRSTSQARTSPGSKSKQRSKSRSRSRSRSNSRSKTKPGPKSKTKSKRRSRSPAKTKPGPKSKTESKAKPRSRSRSASPMKTKPGPKSKTKLKHRSRSRSSSRTKSKPGPKSKTKLKHRSRSNSRSRSQSKPGPKSKTKLKHRSRSASSSKSETKSGSRSRSSSRSKTKPGPKSKTKLKSRSRSNSRSKSPSEPGQKLKNYFMYESGSRSSSGTKSSSRSRSSSRSKTKPGPKSKTKLKDRSRSRSSSRTKSKPGPKSKTKLKHRSRSNSRSRSQSKPGVKSKTKLKHRSRSASSSKSETKSRSRSRSNSHSKTKPGPKSKTKLKNRSRSSSRSKSPAKPGPLSKTKERDRSRSRSNSKTKSADDSRGRSPPRSGMRPKGTSPSPIFIRKPKIFANNDVYSVESEDDTNPYSK